MSSAVSPRYDCAYKTLDTVYSLSIISQYIVLKKASNLILEAISLHGEYPSKSFKCSVFSQGNPFTRQFAVSIIFKIIKCLTKDGRTWECLDSSRIGVTFFENSDTTQVTFMIRTPLNLGLNPWLKPYSRFYSQLRIYKNHAFFDRIYIFSLI